jgi:anti-sigma regulatory factor (Ser/Thr protein kinase)
MVRRQREYDGALSQLASMRTFLREVGQECGPAGPVEESLLLRLTLALTEAASNIILHGFEGQEPQSITMTVEVKHDVVGVTLQYPGRPFDPEAAAEPAFDGSRESGFGLYLIRKCVDEVRYGQDDAGRCLIELVQKRKPRPPGEDHAARD